MKRIVISLSFALTVVVSLLLLDSCKKEEVILNSATLSSEVVPAESVGQFLCKNTQSCNRIAQIVR